MKIKTEITIKINLTTYKKLRELKRTGGAPIKFLVDKAVESLYNNKQE